MNLRFLTSSRLKDARACQRLHHLRYDLGYTPVQTDDVLRFGTLVHRGLEAWWLAMKDGGNALETALEAVQGEADPYDRARAEAVLTGYHIRWNDSRLKVLGVEVEFETELRNPATGASSRTWRIAGKIDAIVQDADGRILTVEHKTSSEDISLGSDYWKRLRLDGQVSIYFTGARQALQLDVAACMYDVLLKPAQRPGNVPLIDEDGVKIVLDTTGQRVRTKDGKKWRQTADADAGYVLQTRPETPAEFQARVMEAIAAEPERFYSRGDVVRLADEIDEAGFDMWQLGQQLREAELAGRFPRNVDSCVRYGRTCPYFAVCTGAASLDDRTLYQRSDVIHPELNLTQKEAVS